VLGFFSSRSHFDSTTPFGSRGEALACGRGGVPIPTRGQALWYSRYICTLCVRPTVEASFEVVYDWHVNVNLCMYYVTYVDEFSLVASLEVVEDGGLVQIRQVRHILTLLELRWIHLIQDKNFTSSINKSIFIS
jgi:hypothetical protein